MSRLETKNIKQLVIDTVTQPLSIGGIATDNSDAVMTISGAGVLTVGSVALGNGSTATTQSVGNNTTNIATTAFVNAEISNDSILKSLLTTTGDIIYASAASTPARLAAGTSGYYLKANGAGVAPSWAAISFPSGVTSGSTTTSTWVNYNGTTASAGLWDGGTTAPTGTTRLNYGGYLYATRLYGAVYNDYAEYFTKGEEVEAGDVIAKDPNSNKFIKAIGAYNKRVVGVYSDSYGHCLGGNGDENDEQNFIPIGLAGRVSVKVIGQVEEGDLLVASEIPGVAMKSEGHIPGTIIGKALESNSNSGVNKIKMFIMNI